jgi:hypothetical protein
MTTMSYAPESGSDHTRRLIKKKMTKDKLFPSIEAAAGAGLHISVFLVIGYPHDRPEHIAENLPFLDELSHRGVGDIGINFYMALPGTELFRSLYDAGRIRIERRYFRHILNSLAPIPSQSYCDTLSRMDLAFWKFRMFRRFYSATKRSGEAGLFPAVLRGLRGLIRKGDHQTKMETAVRHALITGIESFLTLFRKRYMPMAAERAMIATWDPIYRRVHEQKLECGAVERMASDTTELYRGNIIPVLLREHRTERTVVSMGA